MAIRSFDQLKYEATWLGPRKVAIAAAANADVLTAAREAQDAGMAHFTLVDDESRIKQMADQHHIAIDDMAIVHVPTHEAAAQAVMHMVRAGETDIVMKGSVETAVFMRAAVDRENGLRIGRLMTHVAVFEVPGFDRLLLISDAGVVIAPDIYQKVEIVQNSIEVAHKLGLELPNVAILAAAELVDPKIISTVDAANLSKMADRGQLRGAVVDGPLALDNAISATSAEIKGIKSPVAGKADVLIVPDIEAGNLLVKALTYFAKGEMAGVVVGGCAPIVVTSRSDSPRSKMMSIALAVLLSTEGHCTLKLGEE